MSWVKKTVGRLFGSRTEEEYEIEETTNVTQEELEETNTPQRSAFRFPMITDAEIYGWEENSEHSHVMSKKPSPSKNHEPYKDEPVTPLYQNDRWPTEPEIGTIHRASGQTKYREKAEFKPKMKPTLKSSIEKNNKSGKTERKSNVVNKRNNEPFKPTEVPSPVYGFAPPKKHNTVLTKMPVEHELTSVTRADELSSNQHVPSDEISPSGSLLIENTIHQSTHNPISNSTKDEVEKSDEDFQQPNYSICEEPSIEEELLLLQEEPISDKSFEQFELVEKQESDVTENRSQLVEESEVVEAENLEAVQSNVSIALMEPQSEEVEVIKSTKQILTISDANNSSSTKMEETKTEEFSEPIEIRKERVSPFNVVMLKSDKQKEKMRALAETSSSDRTTIVSAPQGTLKAQDIKSPTLTEQATSVEQRELQPVIQETKPKPIEAMLSAPVVGEGTNPPEEEELLPHYVFPSMNNLLAPEAQLEDTEWLTSQSEKLVEALSHFAIKAEILEAIQGPTVTRFELTVGFGIKVSKIRNLTDDLKLALAAEDIRIQAPIPGTSSIGIEIPNRTTRPVRISEVINTKKFASSDSPLEAVLGLSLTGEPVTLDLRKMPHGMIAGATGSGKSVCINSILVSLLYKASPTELKMMLIDPKMVELAPFNGIPHLISPVITDVKAATAALKWAVNEMERRYELFAHAGARNIERYNEMAEENRQFSLKMPYLLIVIDELADLMMVAPADVEVSISRIAQKARACGIHLIIATQRPSVDVITGIIKANIPTRIAFAVSSQIDSRTIIDGAGADRLLGKGDMLYVGNGQSSPNRLQGTFVTDDEIEKVIEHVKKEASPEYLFGQEELLAAVVEEEETDPLFTQACSFIIEQGSASTSLLQRHFSIGYNRAAKLMDRIEAHGFISEQRGSRSRDVFVTEADLDALLNPSNNA